MLVGEKTMVGKETQPSVGKMEAFHVAPRRTPCFLPFWDSEGMDDRLPALEKENHLKTKINYYIKEKRRQRENTWWMENKISVNKQIHFSSHTI